MSAATIPNVFSAFNLAEFFVSSTPFNNLWPRMDPAFAVHSQSKLCC